MTGLAQAVLMGFKELYQRPDKDSHKPRHLYFSRSSLAWASGLGHQRTSGQFRVETEKSFKNPFVDAPVPGIRAYVGRGLVFHRDECGEHALEQHSTAFITPGGERV